MRTDLDIVLNRPVKLTLGTVDEQFVVEIREPSNEELGEYLALINVSITKLLRDNLPLITAAVKGEDVSRIDADLAGLSDVTTLLVAKIVGKPPEYVRKEMSARQSVAVIHAFLDVLGWEFIRASFQQATKAWSQAGNPQKSANVEAPSWSVDASSKSPARSPN